MQGHHFQSLQGNPQRFIVLVLKPLDVGQIIKASHDEERVKVSALEVRLAFFEDLLGLVDAIQSGV